MQTQNCIQDSNKSDELDLFDLIKKCWECFKQYVWRPFLFCFKYILRKWWIGLLAIACGFGMSVISWQLKPVYTGQIIMKSNSCSSNDFINDLRLLSITTADYKMNVFHLSYDKAKNIKGIWGHHLCYMDSTHTGYVVDIADQMEAKGEVCVSNMFAVDMAVTDCAVFDSIQQALITYFNEGEYYVKQNELRQLTMRKTMDILNLEAQKLDSTRGKWDGRVLAESQLVNGKMSSAVLSPTVISNEIINLQNRVCELDNAIKYSPEIVTVVTPLRYNSVPKNFYIFTWYKYVSLCFVLAYVFAMLISFRKQIISFVKN